MLCLLESNENVVIVWPFRVIDFVWLWQLEKMWPKVIGIDWFLLWPPTAIAIAYNEILIFFEIDYIFRSICVDFLKWIIFVFLIFSKIPYRNQCIRNVVIKWKAQQNPRQIPLVEIRKRMASLPSEKFPKKMAWIQ